MLALLAWSDTREFYKYVRLRCKLGGHVLGKVVLPKDATVEAKLVFMQEQVARRMVHPARSPNFVRLFVGAEELTTSSFLIYQSFEDRMLKACAEQQELVAKLLDPKSVDVDAMWEEDDSWAKQRLAVLGYTHELRKCELGPEVLHIQCNSKAKLAVVPEMKIFDCPQRPNLLLEASRWSEKVYLGDISVFKWLKGLILRHNFYGCSSLAASSLQNLRVPCLTPRIQRAIKNHKTLERLAVSYLQSIPPTFGELTYLKHLEVTVSSLRDNLPKLRSLVNLESLRISIHKVTDTMPSEIGLLTNLKTLRVSPNLQGSLPKEFAHLEKLENLDLSFNPDFDDSDFKFETMPKLTIINARATRAHFPLGPEWTEDDRVWSRLIC